MIKLIAIDMDGTLLDSQKQLPAENAAALRQAVDKGVKIVLCTGRPKFGVLPYFKELNLPGGQEEYAILDNGCTTYRTQDWSLLSHTELSVEAIEELTASLAGYEGVCLTFFDQSHYFVLGDQVPELVAYDAGLVFTKATPVNLETLVESPDPIFQAMFVGEADKLDAFQAAWDQSLSQCCSMVRSQFYLYEALPKGVTKGHALRALAAHLGLKRHEVMAIGDAANDLEMLEFAGLSVAMGNASEEVKALTDHVTADCDHAGVAQAIETFVLQEIGQ